MLDIIKKIFGSANDKAVKDLAKTVEKINALEGKYSALSDDELCAMTEKFKGEIKNGKSLDELLPDAYAAFREAAKRILGQRAFDVQLMGAIALHQGRIAEMRTGEGKTITATFPAYLNALTGKGVHIVTVNEYLARFHSEWMGKVFRFMGMKVGLICHDMTPEQRQEAYSADITYGTNNELGFDYLRDNMTARKERLVQRELNFAIVDEVDSILIDEARTPLIISGQGDKSTDMYKRANQLIPQLKEATEKNEKDEVIPESGDYIRDEKQKSASLTESGVKKAERFFGIENLTDPSNVTTYHHVLQALKANVIMKRDVDYVLKDGNVVIVDAFTGRLMEGRRYSDGLHQAIEAKENVTVNRESQTLATITFQNYFRMYHKLSGMTGTAKTEEDEFRGIYHLDVVTIPTNRPMIRKDMNDAIYFTQKAKYAAVVEDVVKCHESGRPVLVGTVSVEKSEMLSRILDLRGIPHAVLDAKLHEKEAEIVAQAGRKGAVTISTNMAGRGTDILLGGNPEFMARQELRKAGYEEQIIEEALGRNEHVSEEVLEARKKFNEIYPAFKQETDKGHEEVVALGGLHIIGTERHESRRIDNQLRGRAGRQGDPGSSRFFVALDDDLMRMFGGDRLKTVTQMLGSKLAGDEAIENKILTDLIENCQKKVEGLNYSRRKQVLQYDDVMNTQREVIYSQRRQVLMGDDMHESIMNMRNSLIEEAVQRYCVGNTDWETWDIKGLSDYLEKLCLKPENVKTVFDTLAEPTHGEFTNKLEEYSDVFYQEHKAEIEEVGVQMPELERAMLLRSVDHRWMDHIDAMDQLKEGVGLRAYGQHDPVLEYKHDGYEMFEEMSRLIQEDTVRSVFYIRLVRREQAEQPAEKERKLVASHGDSEPVRKQPVKSAVKVGRNDLCPCGSGKKYKECCGKNA